MISTRLSLSKAYVSLKSKQKDTALDLFNVSTVTYDYIAEQKEKRAKYLPEQYYAKAMLYRDR